MALRWFNHSWKPCFIANWFHAENECTKTYFLPYSWHVTFFSIKCHQCTVYKRVLASSAGSNFIWILLWVEASFGLPVLSFSASVCLCVRRPSVCGNHVLVCKITHHPFMLGSPNSDHRGKRPWLRSLLCWVDWHWPSRSNFTLKSKFTPFWACCAITLHSFKLGPTNLTVRQWSCIFSVTIVRFAVLDSAICNGFWIGFVGLRQIIQNSDAKIWYANIR